MPNAADVGDAFQRPQLLTILLSNTIAVAASFCHPGRDHPEDCFAEIGNTFIYLEILEGWFTASLPPKKKRWCLCVSSMETLIMQMSQICNMLLRRANLCNKGVALLSRLIPIINSQSNANPGMDFRFWRTHFAEIMNIWISGGLVERRDDPYQTRTLEVIQSMIGSE